MEQMLLCLDLMGSVAFAVSGVLVGVRRKMDVFGVNVLAVITATGGGILRDILIGDLPPAAFRNPFHVTVAVVTANLAICFMLLHPHLPGRVTGAYNRIMFWFDTLGVAAFTVDGVMIGVEHGYRDNLFLLVFLGVMTGVGGGILRDILADQMPEVLRRHVYATASVAGGLMTGLLMQYSVTARGSLLAGFSTVVLLRALAAHFRWNLPRIE